MAEDKPMYNYPQSIPLCSTWLDQKSGHKEGREWTWRDRSRSKGNEVGFGNHSMDKRMPFWKTVIY